MNSRENPNKLTPKTEDFSLDERLETKENVSILPSENSVVPISPTLNKVESRDEVDKVPFKEEYLDILETSGCKPELISAQSEKNPAFSSETLLPISNDTFSLVTPSINLANPNSEFPSNYKVVECLISKIQSSLDHSRHYIHLLQQTRQALVRQSSSNARLYQELREARKMPGPSETSH